MAHNLHTKRLYFEPILALQAEEMQDVLCDPRVYEYIDEPCIDLAELHSDFEQRQAGPPGHRSGEHWLDLLIRIKDSNQAIGRIEATVIGENAEVAYMLGAAFWGHGYATEALTWLQSHLQSEFSVRSFWAAIKPGNLRSIRVVERVGYVQVPNPASPRLTSYNSGDLVFQHRIHSDANVDHQGAK